VSQETKWLAVIQAILTQIITALSNTQSDMYGYRVHRSRCLSLLCRRCVSHDLYLCRDNTLHQVQNQLLHHADIVLNQLQDISMTVQIYQKYHKQLGPRNCTSAKKTRPECKPMPVPTFQPNVIRDLNLDRRINLHADVRWINPKML